MTDAKVSLTLHDLSPEEVAAVMAVVGGEAAPAEKKTTTRKRTTTKKEEPKKETPKEDDSGDSDDGGTPIKREKVVEALKTYRGEYSKEAAEAIIHGPGKSKNISGIKEENFAAVLEACSKPPAEDDEDGDDW